MPRGWGVWVDVVIVLARQFKSWKYYIELHGWMAFALDVASIVVIALELDSNEYAGSDPIVNAHNIIGLIFLGLVIFHRKKKTQFANDKYS